MLYTFSWKLLDKTGLTNGPLFCAERNSRKKELGTKLMSLVTMYNLLQGYLSRLPASMGEEEVTAEDGTVRKVKRCIGLLPKNWSSRNGSPPVD